MKSLFKTKDIITDNVYTKKVNIPQYEPSSNVPDICELCNMEKYSKLLNSINSSDISEKEKQFLRFAACRHIVFNYSKIADYYAHATPDMQNLMEESALVILDVNDAIANGYIKFSKNVLNIMKNTGEKTSER